MFGLDENKEKILEKLINDLKQLDKEDLVLLQNGADFLKARDEMGRIEKAENKVG